ncbi:MAG: phage portal protein, partial [Oscillospiraceae bacterium]
MNKIKLLERFKPQSKACTVQTACEQNHPFTLLGDYAPLSGSNYRLYDSIREAIPIIDAAVYKIIRLMGSFTVECEDKRLEEQLKRFLTEIPVGASSYGINSFLSSYLEDMLVYGNGIGEMVVSGDGNELEGLYNCHPKDVGIKSGDDEMHPVIGVITDGYGWEKAPMQELLLFTPLNPASGEITGRSMLEGLPFMSDILLKIYHSIGKNFERMGNLRFAVTYKPTGGVSERTYAKDIATNIANQWQNAMSEAKNGVIKDFIAVGDVDIKVIGADNQMLDTEIPVRQMLEQIVAKLGIPPFLLGLNWNSTERMSKLQTDILTSEL